jgi:hypothetical protein
LKHKDRFLAVTLHIFGHLFSWIQHFSPFCALTPSYLSTPIFCFPNLSLSAEQQLPFEAASTKQQTPAGDERIYGRRYSKYVLLTSLRPDTLVPCSAYRRPFTLLLVAADPVRTKHGVKHSTIQQRPFAVTAKVSSF